MAFLVERRCILSRQVRCNAAPHSPRGAFRWWRQRSGDPNRTCLTGDDTYSENDYTEIGYIYANERKAPDLILNTCFIQHLVHSVADNGT